MYDCGDVVFDAFDGDGVAVDEAGVEWTMDEQKLLSKDGRSLRRLPAHRVFWFGWNAAYPSTRLVK